MFLNVSFNFATAISKFDTFSSYHIVHTRIAKVTNFFPFLHFGISMYQKRILPYFIIPYFLTPSFFLFKPSQTDRQRNFNTPCSLSYFFFPLSARGPTRRRNSTGLAELWGGWPIELGHLEEDTMLTEQSCKTIIRNWIILLWGKLYVPLLNSYIRFSLCRDC